MEALKKRLLSTIELHGKCDIHGLQLMYKDVSKITVIKGLFHLKNEGWIKLNKTRTIDGIVSNNPCVFRTKKTLYIQLSLL
jgi:hypothetical protein